MEATVAPVPIGDLLRSWRRRRKLSQLALALNAEVSARHVSFVETGRARPSREMVVRLSEELEIPLRERNALLLAAGYAPLYSNGSLDSAPMEVVRRAIDRFLRAHEPYPALVVDRHHNVLSSNDALAELLDGVDADLLEAPANAMRLALHPRGLAPRTVNLGDWSAHLLHRLRREISATGDAQLTDLYDELSGYPGVRSVPRNPAAPVDELVLPLRLRDPSDGAELALFSTLSAFGSAVDLTVSELTIEAFYPANAATATRLLRHIDPGESH